MLDARRIEWNVGQEESQVSAHHRHVQHANEIKSIAHQLELENVMTIMNTPPAAGHDFVGISEFLVNEFTNSAQIDPSVTALANGHFVVTWQS
ncbi:hypothetical protein, partial [Yoonia sp. R2-816]|uniref:hypothetical protein n=1 Tax=Yoonia sp. R2-816 TaxID=3342638 RepID=UPI00372AF215